MAQESAIETPTAEDLARLDRNRKGKKLSNQDWVSKSDPEAKIAKMKDGTTHRPTSPSTRWIWTPARWWRRATPGRRGRHDDAGEDAGGAKENLEAGGDAAPTAEDPAECVTTRAITHGPSLKGARRRPLEDADLRAQAERFCALARRRGGPPGSHQHRTRLLSGVAKEAFKLRAEIVERSFAHNLDRGGMRRTWLRGRENVHAIPAPCRRPQSSLLMRKLGAGTPREAVAVFACLLRQRSRSGRSDGPHRLGGWRNRLRRVMFRRRVKPGQ